jgi:hypothetical protein
MVEAPRSDYRSGMTVHGLHDSHERIYPMGLLAAVVRAQQAGFGAAMCWDHFSRCKERRHLEEIYLHHVGDEQEEASPRSVAVYYRSCHEAD